jgi:hypothetical protein
MASFLFLTAACALIAAVTASDLLPLKFRTYTFQITTSVPSASSYFNLGIYHEFGFNQHEARAAMARAVAADPFCAMCQWGLAYAWGPFLNHPIMDREQQQRSHDAIRKAAELQRGGGNQSGTPLERSLVAVLSVRYPAPTNSTNQTAAFVSYADALGRLSETMSSRPDPNVRRARGGREKERERETERERDTQRERQRDRETERQRQRDRETGRETGRQGDRETERQTERVRLVIP